ncbi:glutamate racemase [Actinocorallia longicatena]|uniref:Aspartate/glutamate racemase family protein n=1 Tax=Actinocorallia longicatena TaxID=111803 RepID=A0ABP6QRR2_9ACTN
MRIALVDSGFGLLAAAAAVREARPDADLVLSNDVEGMPWGPRTPEDITERVLACAGAALDLEPDALIVACNTASVHALPALRERLEPGLPVIGTVPAIKPAAAAGEAFAVWATVATTRSAYQADLIARFAPGLPVAAVACPGLAEAIEHADEDALAEALADAASRTPAGVRRVVLGCTHYELVAAEIGAALARGGPAPELFGPAAALARQALDRLGEQARPDASGTGGLVLLQNGRSTPIPAALLRYPQTRVLGSVQVEGATPV